MIKIDFKKELAHLYNPSPVKPEIVDVPKMNFLMMDGKGDPNTSQDYQNAVEVLYSVSYTLKFMIKKGIHAVDYGVLPLEGLWWADDMADFLAGRKDQWQWTAMIMQPELAGEELVFEAMEAVQKKKKWPGMEALRFASFDEGPSAQIMHIGPFSEEGPTIAKLHQFILDQKYRLRAKHHEIYLSDIRRGDPRKWKTVIRQPIQ